jgi:hypothetical protein
LSFFCAKRLSSSPSVPRITVSDGIVRLNAMAAFRSGIAAARAVISERSR